jgi:3-ketosteroid 9alpha-monooxygenase subunit B
MIPPVSVESPEVQVSAEVPEPREGRKKVKELECMVSDVVMETHDTATLYLFTGNERLSYEPGHFLSIDPHQFPALERWTRFLEDQKSRKEPPRAYSLASAPHERYLAITVKEEAYVSGATKYPPLLSPMLVRRLFKGTHMIVIGFAGPYILPPDIEKRTDHLVHVCAGSGFVPNYSIIKHAIENRMKLRHTIVYGNKTWEDVIFRKQLDELAAKHPDKVTLVHTLTRDPHAASRGPNVRQGRVNTALLRELIPDPSACEVFTCGPGITKYDRQAAKEKGIDPAPRFLESALASLAELGIKRDQIHRESYG